MTSPPPRTVRALGLVFWAWVAMTVEWPLQWLVFQIIPGLSLETYLLVSKCFSVVSLAANSVLLAGLVGLVEWQRANAWVRAATAATFASLLLTLGSLVHRLSGAELDVRWLGPVFILVHNAKATLVVLVLHRARQPRGWASWLWPLLGSMLVFDLVIPLLPELGLGWVHAERLVQAMNMVLGLGVDVAILVLIHDVRRRLADGGAEAGAPRAVPVEEAAWKQVERGLGLYAGALAWRLAITLGGALIAFSLRGAGASGQILTILIAVGGLIPSGFLVAAMGRVALAPMATRAGVLAGGAAMAAGVNMLADLYSTTLLVRIAAQPRRYWAILDAVERVLWAQGTSFVLGLTATFLFLASLRRVAGALERSELVSDVDALLLMLGISLALGIITVLALTQARATVVAAVFALGLVVVGIWMLARLFGLLRALRSAISARAS